MAWRQPPGTGSRGARGMRAAGLRRAGRAATGAAGVAGPGPGPGRPGRHGRGGAAACGAGGGRYGARKATSFQLREGPERGLVERYLQEVDRVVQITFPAGEERARLGEGEWAVTMKPQEFFTVRFQARCTIRTFYTAERGLCIEVKHLELLGMPEAFADADPRILVQGNLKPLLVPGPFRRLKGQVTLDLDVKVPEPFNSFPGVTEVIEALLHAVLDNLQRSLEAGIAKDFEVWKAEDAARQAQLGAENVNVSAVE